MSTSDFSRRGFLTLVGVGAAGAYAGRAIAGPFFDPPGDFPVPADKKFSPEWLASLRARGTALVASSTRDELKFVGMPVGGLCCGQVYLSGDGRLWSWDIFNLPPTREWTDTAGPLYARPAPVASPFRIEFAIDMDGKPRVLDSRGFRDIAFTGQYPVASVRYADKDAPIQAELRAFSPFCPLSVEDSSIPCTILLYRFTNAGEKPTRFAFRAGLENPVAHATAQHGEVKRINVVGAKNALVCRGEPASTEPPKPEREDIVFESFEGGTYDRWTVTGTAFGDKPRKLSDIVGYQGFMNAQGQGLANTHETRHGEDVRAADQHIGTLTSREFTIERKFISMRLGGGKHPGQTCVNLLIDGAPVRTSTGQNQNRMRLENWNVEEFAGKQARIQAVDGWRGEWGNIGLDEIALTDVERREPYDAKNAPDFGTMAMALISRQDGATVEPNAVPGAAPVGEIRVPLELKPGESAEVSLVVAWHFPNVNREQLGFIAGIGRLRRHYAKRFGDAEAVVDFARANAQRLMEQTLRWRDTWYDSTLPIWFLDRTFANISTAATSTCYHFDSGRFYGWEGTHCCAGTCTHVWQYAQGLARVFPEFERYLRREIDFGAEFNAETGLIHYRGEAARSLAIDGQCGTIVRAWREHTMSADDSFLRAVYPHVKKATELVLARDPDQNGILDGEQYNTLDTSWYGKIAWISSLYLAALRAAAAMAADAGDAEFRERCNAVADRGFAVFAKELFNGEYFVHRTDPAHPEANSTGDGCHIDQVMGQSFAWQMGLPRVVPEKETVSALQALYRYSFTPDIGPYRNYAEKTVKGGRWYAMPGEGGLLMCTWPHGGSESATGKSNDAWAAGYFNECMSGFEHQVASHMIAEGLVTEGLAVTRMIHDRYHPSRRNPYNEVECSNHYARAMASYGSFVTACGFTHHGPRGEIGFEPRVFAETGNRFFRAAFVAAEGWGTYAQALDAVVTYQLAVSYGVLKLRKLTLPILRVMQREQVDLKINGKGQAIRLKTVATRSETETVSGFGSFVLTFGEDAIELKTGDTLTVRIKEQG